MILRPKYNVIYSSSVNLDDTITACEMFTGEMITVTPTIIYAVGIAYLTQVSITLNVKYGSIGIYAPTVTLKDPEGNAYVLNRSGFSAVYLAYTHIPLEIGIYTVEIDGFSYTLANTEICTKAVNATFETTILEVLPAPIAAFTYTLDAATLSNLDASGSISYNGSLTYDWDWGDGSAHGTGVTPANHTYPYNGSYTLTLTVTDSGGGTGTYSVVMVVAIPPVAVIDTPVAMFNSGGIIVYALRGDDSTSGDLDGEANQWKWTFIDDMTDEVIASTNFGGGNLVGYDFINNLGDWISGPYDGPNFIPNAFQLAYNTKATHIRIRLQVKDDQGVTSTNTEEVVVYALPVARWADDEYPNLSDGEVDVVDYNFSSGHFALVGYLMNEAGKPFIPFTNRKVNLLIKRTVDDATLADLQFDYSTFINSATQTPETETSYGAGITNWADLKNYLTFTVTNLGRVDTLFKKYLYAVDHTFVDGDDDIADASRIVSIEVSAVENDDVALTSRTTRADLQVISGDFEEVGAGYIAYSPLKQRIYLGLINKLAEFYFDGERGFYLTIQNNNFSAATAAVNPAVKGIAVGKYDTSGDARLDPDLFLNLTATGAEHSLNKWRFDGATDERWEFIEDLDNVGIVGQGLTAYTRLEFFNDWIYFVAGVNAGTSRLDVVFRDSGSTWNKVSLITAASAITQINGIAVDENNNIFFVGQNCIRALLWTPTTEDPDDPSTWTAVGTGFTLATIAGTVGISGNMLGLGTDSMFPTIHDIIILDENYNGFSLPRLVITTNLNQLILITPIGGGEFTTSLLLGSTVGVAGNIDGAGSVARLTNPIGLAKVSDTIFFVCDDHGIKKVTVTTSSTTSASIETIVAFNNDRRITTGEKVLF